MTSTGRAVRLGAATAVVALLVAGTAFGEDDHFPFGPLRMYANATQRTGAVSFPVLEADTVDGEALRFRDKDLGLRRAELEGQLRLAADHDELLAGLAEAYRRFHPDGPELAELRIVRVSRRLEAGRVVGREERVVAIWPAEGTG